MCQQLQIKSICDPEKYRHISIYMEKPDEWISTKLPLSSPEKCALKSPVNHLAAERLLISEDKGLG